MKRMLLALALAAAPTLAEESKPVATQIGEAVRPAAEAYGKTMTGWSTNTWLGPAKAPLAMQPEPTSKPRINENAKPIAGFVAP